MLGFALVVKKILKPTTTDICVPKSQPASVAEDFFKRPVLTYMRNWNQTFVIRIPLKKNRLLVFAVMLHAIQNIVLKDINLFVQESEILGLNA